MIKKTIVLAFSISVMQVKADVNRVWPPNDKTITPPTAAYDLLDRVKQQLKSPPKIDADIIWKSMPESMKEAMYYSYWAITEYGGHIAPIFPELINKITNEGSHNLPEITEDSKIQEIPFLNNALKQLVKNKSFIESAKSFINNKTIEKKSNLINL